MMMLLLCFSMGARADNVITISSAEGAPNEEVTVSIGLENSDAVSTLQVSIPLDENLTLIENSGQLGTRCTNHSLTLGVKDGVLNIFVYSLSMAAITGSNGEVANFSLKLGSQPTTIALTPSKTVLTNTAGQTVDASANSGEVTIRCAKAQYSTMEVDFGEVPIRGTYQRTVTVTNVGNSDLTITALTFSDVMTFSSTTSLPLVISAGDSRALNVTYAPTERGSISKTLKVECNSVSKLNTIKLLAQPFAVNELHIQPTSGISDEEVTISMTMNNMDAISGYQVEFNMPKQFEYVDNSFELSSRKQDHVGMATLNGQKLRIIAYSPSDKAFTGDDGVIGTFRVKLVGRYGTTLTPSKTVLSATINNKVENVVSDVYGGQIDIQSPQISCSSQLDFGAVSVTEACEKTFTVSNYGSAPLTISRVVFNNENLSIKETLPLIIPTWGSADITVVYSSVEQTAFEATMNIYSNDPDLRMKEVHVTGSRFAPNYLDVDIQDITYRDNLAIALSLNTFDAVSGLQFDIEYPGKYFTTFENNFTLNERAQGMTVTSRQMDANTLRVFCYFIGQGSIAPGNSNIMSYLLKPVNEDVPLGEYSVIIKNIKFGTQALTDKYAGQDITRSFHLNPIVPVVVTAKSYTRVYGEENPDFEYTSEGATLKGTPEISCEATLSSPVGTYPIVITKGGVKNYDDTYVNGVLTITKAPLTITTGNYTKKQGEAMPEFTLSYEGFKNNETKDVLTKQPTVSCEATVASAPGEYPVTVSGAEAQNYNINYTNGKLIVTEADLITIKAKSYTREYGEINPAFEFTTEGATLEGTPEISCEATATSPVGTYDIIVTKGTVANYNVTYVAGTLTITKTPLSIIAGTYTKKQGEAMPEFTLSYEGFKNNETKDVLTKLPTVSCEATVASAPGEYPVTVSGAEAQNYSISYTNGKLVVTAADPVTITAKSYTREYGETNPAFEFTTEGATLEGVPEISCEATATSPVGTYDIIVTKGTVANYNVTYVAGTLTITKTPLTIAAGTYTKKQGEAMPEFTLSYEGFKNNETKDVLTKLPTVSCEATVASAPGEYPVTVSGAEAQNYSISYTNGKLIVTEADLITIKAKSYTREYGETNPAFEFTTEGATLEGVPEISCEATATSPVGTYDIIVTKGTVANYNVTYVAGTLTITKTPLTIAAGIYTKKQGEAMPEFTLSYEGFKNNETKDVLTKQPTVSCNATVASAPGEYPVTISGAEAQNYNINYTNGKLIVTEADLITIKAKSYTREYGEINPTFEFTTEGATLEGVPEITCEATATTPVGTYDIIVKQGTVTNYNVTYAKGTLTITKAPLTASVGNYSREYKQKDPEFVINYSGWKNGDDESVLIAKPVATTTATKESPVGEYPITVSGGEAQNYEFNYVNGVLTVTKTTDISDAQITNKKKESKTVYDLQGRKVTNMKKGLYIVGGRKVVK